MFKDSELKEVQPHIENIIRSVVINPKDCEDIIQDVNFIILSKRYEFDSSKQLKPWACTIARFQIKKYLKSKKRWNRKHIDFDHADFPLVENPMHYFITDEKIQLEKDLSALLSERQYSIYKYLNKGYTIKEISKKMNLKTTDVSRAKSAMILNVRSFLKKICL